MNGTLRERLASGPMRGLGQGNLIAVEVLRDEADAKELVDALRDQNAWVVLRAANALRKVAEKRPELVAPHSRKMLHAAAAITEIRARWNVVNVLGNLPLKGAQRSLAIDLFFEALGNRSGILRTFALQALFNFSADDIGLRRRVLPIAERFAATGTPAMRARARMLLKKMR